MILYYYLHKNKAPDSNYVRGFLNWWRRRDSVSTPFEVGWTMPSSCDIPGCGASYPLAKWILSTRSSVKDQQAYESLQGSPEVCPLATPRRYHDIPVPLTLTKGERE